MNYQPPHNIPEGGRPQLFYHFVFYFFLNFIPLGKITAPDSKLPTCYRIHNSALVEVCCTKILCERLHIITHNTEKYLGVILDPEMVQKI